MLVYKRLYFLQKFATHSKFNEQRLLFELRFIKLTTGRQDRQTETNLALRHVSFLFHRVLEGSFVSCIFSYSLIITSKTQTHVKVKQSHYRPGQAPRFPGGWSSQISKQWAHKSGKVVSHTHRPPSTPQEIFLVLISVGDTRWGSWLRHCATSRKVAGSIPYGIIGIFH
jgi:hypothetical protein